MKRPVEDGVYPKLLRSFEAQTSAEIEAVAESVGKSVVAVLLTGIGTDGAKGMLKIQQAGGKTIARMKLLLLFLVCPRPLQSLVRPTRSCLTTRLPTQFQFYAEKRSEALAGFFLR